MKRRSRFDDILNLGQSHGRRSSRFSGFYLSPVEF